MGLKFNKITILRYSWSRNDFLEGSNTKTGLRKKKLISGWARTTLFLRWLVLQYYSAAWWSCKLSPNSLWIHSVPTVCTGLHVDGVLPSMLLFWKAKIGISNFHAKFDNDTYLFSTITFLRRKLFMSKRLLLDYSVYLYQSSDIHCYGHCQWWAISRKIAINQFFFGRLK